MEGTPFGRYRLIDLVGRGGMGEVWRAFDTVTERVVALKVLPTQFADDATFQERFRREARAAAALDEPHIVPIHDFGEIDGKLYVTMRLINGRDLHTILNEGRLEAGRAVAIVDQIASALHAAHRVDLVHRDVKPSNILVTDDDFAYLIDFGIARTAGQSGLTNTSSVIGTWAYMAPERITTAESDARADIYALACVLYECLTGSQPFPGDSLEQQIGGHIALPPPTASHRHQDVPALLDSVIARGMAKNPAERYSTTREMALAAKAAIAYRPAAPTHLTPTLPTQFDPQHLNNPYPNSYPERSTPTVIGAPGWPPSDARYTTAPSAPTRYTPAPYDATQYRPAQQDPTQYRPSPHDPIRTAPPPSRKRLVIGLSSAAAVAAIVAIVAAVVLSNSDDQAASPPVASSSPPAPNAAVNTGPFTGTYTVEFSATTKWNGEPWPNPAPPYTETWRVSSACNGNGCAATAETGGKYPSKSLVFDQVDGRWVAISNSQGTCKQMSGELWNSLSLQEQSGGNMTGEFTQTQQNGCLSKRTVTLRRTGDVVTSSLPDPSTQPARVTTPAEGLRGRYHEVLKGNRVREYDNGVRTDCLRNGKRCMSYFVDLQTGSSRALIFENGQWTRNSTYDADCTSGGRDHITNIGTFPLPQPTQDPIPVLIGTGRIQIAPGSTSKCKSVDYEQTFTRTGD